jgi:hypothetical protein
MEGGTSGRGESLATISSISNFLFPRAESSTSRWLSGVLESLGRPFEGTWAPFAFRREMPCEGLEEATFAGDRPGVAQWLQAAATFSLFS